MGVYINIQALLIFIIAILEVDIVKVSGLQVRADA
jgi:hypothetical protein